MRIDVRLDTSELKAKTLREQKRLAYATVKALNETTKAIQTAERVNLDRTLTIRKAGFIYRLVKIFQFASVKKGVIYTEIGIDNTKQRVLLPILEEGGEKEPVKGKRVAVPITGSAARPAFRDPVQDQFTFKSLRFHRHTTSGGKTQFKGGDRTFILKHTRQQPQGGVFQRVGSGRDDIRLLYSFRNRPRLQAILRFVELASRVYGEQFQVEFDRAYRTRS